MHRVKDFLATADGPKKSKDMKYCGKGTVASSFNSQSPRANAPFPFLLPYGSRGCGGAGTTRCRKLNRTLKGFAEWEEPAFSDHVTRLLKML